MKEDEEEEEEREKERSGSEIQVVASHIFLGAVREIDTKEHTYIYFIIYTLLYCAVVINKRNLCASLRTFADSSQNNFV